VVNHTKYSEHRSITQDYTNLINLLEQIEYVFSDWHLRDIEGGLPVEEPSDIYAYCTGRIAMIEPMYRQLIKLGKLVAGHAFGVNDPTESEMLDMDQMIDPNMSSIVQSRLSMMLTMRDCASRVNLCLDMYKFYENQRRQVKDRISV
jgi:hypothetical protein